MNIEPAKFATALNCMDGRVQKPVTEWIRSEYTVDYVDMVTKPGIDKVLSEGSVQDIEELKNYVTISVKEHGSHLVVITGHQDCAGDPVDVETHHRQIKKAVSVVKSWNLEVKIVGLFVNKNFVITVVCGN